MVCLETIRAQQRYYAEHREKILSSGHRFAVIDGGTLAYYDSEKKLYGDYPCFKPGAEPEYGTPPYLIDIEGVNNTIGHQRRVLKERISNFNEDLAALLERGERLATQEKLLKGKKSK